MMKETDAKADEKEVQKLARTLTPTRRTNGEDVEKTKSELLGEARRKITSRLAKQHAPKLCLYLFRHAWMTRLLQEGIDPITVSTLAGHVDTSMLARQYQHLAQDPKHLLSKLRRA